MKLTKYDQERLAYNLKRTAAKFLLVIKNTEFIHKLYEKEFNIISNFLNIRLIRIIFIIYDKNGASGGIIDIDPEPFQASRMAQLLCKAPSNILIHILLLLLSSL